MTHVSVGPDSGPNGAIGAGTLQVNVELTGGFLGPGGVGLGFGDAFGGVAVLNMNRTNLTGGAWTGFGSAFSMAESLRPQLRGLRFFRIQRVKGEISEA